MTLNDSELTHSGWLPREKRQPPNISQELEKLAFLTAQAWKDEYFEKKGSQENLSTQEDFDACVLYVATEMAIAARAVGGAAGLAIVTGGGSRAARFACSRMFADTPEHS